MNHKDRRVLTDWAGLIEQLTSNVEVGLNRAVKDVTAVQGLRNIALDMKTHAGA